MNHEERGWPEDDGQDMVRKESVSGLRFKFFLGEHLILEQKVNCKRVRTRTNLAQKMIEKPASG
jgi:hypothetical protein